LIERFDRVDQNGKLAKRHYTSWSGMDHAHRDMTAAFSYEQLVLVMRRLGLPQSDVTELYRRAVFNVTGRNHDDHTKNFGFLMDRAGHWSLSPAFDMTYAYDPYGQWTRAHQITLNGKSDHFTESDLIAFGRYCNLSTPESKRTLLQTREVFGEFSTLARQFEVPLRLRKTIQTHLRLRL